MCWNKRFLIHSKNLNTNTPNISTERNRFDKTKGSVSNLIQWQEFWIHLTSLMRRKENWIASTTFSSLYVKLNFFHDTLQWNMICTTKTQFLTSISLLTLFLLCYVAVSPMTLTWHFCGGRMLQKVDINLLDLFEAS